MSHSPTRRTNPLLTARQEDLLALVPLVDGNDDHVGGVELDAQPPASAQVHGLDPLVEERKRSTSAPLPQRNSATDESSAMPPPASARPASTCCTSGLEHCWIRAPCDVARHRKPRTCADGRLVRSGR